MTDYTQAKLGELIELAVFNELVESCHVARDAVVISLNGRPLTFTAQGARTFLGSLVQGWVRSEDGRMPAAAPVGVPKEMPALPRQATMIHIPALASTKPESAAPNATHVDALSALELNAVPFPVNDQAKADEAYVDAVLSLAARLRLIESYRKDHASHRIQVKTRATTTDMSYFETLEYLTGSILDELRAQVNVA